jgi:hypothetical protein
VITESEKSLPWEEENLRSRFATSDVSIKEKYIGEI